MKRTILLCCLVIATLLASAQTQQGFVKTKGRLDAKGNLIPGQGLKGATVSVQGRTAVLVNADDGAFSFPAPEAQFRLDSVRKKGYQLVDMDACPRTYKYSSNPLYLVMETPEQQLQDQLAAERKIRRTLTNQLHQREDEIEALKEQQKITDEEYRQALQKLYEDTDQNEQLVKDMVERYSKIDYDQLSKDDQLISNYILNGELTKADSLLRTKGDINQRVSEYRKHEAINTKEREELTERQDQLEQSEALAIQERDDLANDCFRKFEIFKMKHENDSAAYYIELRARLDTTQADWQNSAGGYIQDYISDFSTALDYFRIGLRQNIQKYGEDNDKTASSYYNIGYVYKVQGDYDTAMKYYNRSLNILERVYGHCHPDNVKIYNNMGSIYSDKGDYSKALEFYNTALDIININSTDYSDIIESIYINIGTTYSDLGDYDKALEFYKKAYSVQKDISVDIRPETLIYFIDISEIYYLKDDFDKALECLNNALMISESLYGENHLSTAVCLNSIGYIYQEIRNDSQEALNKFSKALEIEKNIFGEKHPDIAIAYNNIGSVYNEKGDYDKALEYYNKALSIRKAIFGDNHTQVAASYNNIGNVYTYQGDYDNALQCFNNALTILESAYGNNHLYVSICYNHIGFIYSKQGDYIKALEFLSKGLSIQEKLLGPEDARTIESRQKISEIEAKMKEVKEE